MEAFLDEDEESSDETRNTPTNEHVEAGSGSIVREDNSEDNSDSAGDDESGGYIEAHGSQVVPVVPQVADMGALEADHDDYDSDTPAC